MFLRRFVGWVERIRQTNASLLDIHLLVVAVLQIHSVEVFNYFLLHLHFLLFRPLHSLLYIDWEIYLWLQTPNGVVEGFFAAHSVMRVELVERIGQQLIAAVHQESSEAGLNSWFFWQFELVLLPVVSLLDRLLDQALYQIFVLDFLRGQRLFKRTIWTRCLTSACPTFRCGAFRSNRHALQVGSI